MDLNSTSIPAIMRCEQKTRAAAKTSCHAHASSPTDFRIFTIRTIEAFCQGWNYPNFLLAQQFFSAPVYSAIRPEEEKKITKKISIKVGTNNKLHCLGLLDRDNLYTIYSNIFIIQYSNYVHCTFC